MNDLTGVLILDRYELQAELGRGGMGTVYQAYDLVLKRDVAIKLLSATGLGTEGKARMLREAQAAAGLNHPNIITVFDVGEADLGRVDGIAKGATPFVVMELVEGQNLHDKPPQDLEQTLVVTRQLCAALDHAHDHDIIHRDLKPENVLLAADGTARLVDFGLARTVSSRLTTEGAIVGTLAYMAPELALAQEFDGRVDLYSLGVMLYELTTGRLPFTADDPVSIITQHLYAPVVPPRAHNPEIPSSLDALIIKLMAKEPDDRSASATHVLASLERVDLVEEIAPAEELSLLDRIVRGRLVGRESELAEARALWNRAVLGEGQTLLISGEPGIGKTRLIRELTTQVEVTGGSALVGSAYSTGGVPYAPFGQIVRRALQSDGAVTTDLHDSVLADLLKLAPELQSKHGDIPQNPPLEPEYEQKRLFENMVSFGEALSEHEPLLLVLEDAHWADSGTLALLRHLARRLRRRAVMIVATYREEELDDALPFNQILLDLNRERLAARIKLSRFSRQETEAMLGALFAVEITPGLLEGIYRKTEGNPFFIEEVCKSLVESGQLYYEDGSWQRSPDMSDMGIPQSVRIAIQSRVSKFPEAYQETYNLAAILGREFDFDTLAMASDLDEDTLIDALEVAEGAQLIEEVSGKGGATFSFTHALIPTTLADGVRTLRRKRLHQRAAQAIESLRPEAYENLAYYYEQAGDEERARRYYTLAGDRAATAFASQEAESYFRAALVLEPSIDERADLHSSLAEVIDRIGRHEEGIASWKEAVELYAELGNKDRIAWCHARMSRAKHWSGDMEAALEISQEGLELTAGAPESVDMADLIFETAHNYIFIGDPSQAEPLCRQALEMAGRVSAKRVEADSLIILGLLPSVNSEDAIAALNEAVAICQAEKLLVQEARAHNNLGRSIIDFKAKWRAGREHCIKGSEIGRQMGDLSGELLTLGNATWQSITMGELSRAEQMIARLDEISDQLVDPGRSGQHYQEVQAFFEHSRGNLESAAESYRVVYRQTMDSGSVFMIPARSYYLGLALVELDALDEAESVIQHGVEAADQAGVDRVMTRALQAIVLARKENFAQARQVHNKAEQILTERPKAWSSIVLKMAHANLLAAEKRWDEAFSTFQEAANLLAHAEARFPRAIFLRDWAKSHLDRGQTEDLERARELYRETLSEFEAMGSPGYVKRIQAHLDDLQSTNLAVESGGE